MLGCKIAKVDALVVAGAQRLTTKNGLGWTGAMMSTTIEGVARVFEGGKANISKANHIAEMFAEKGDAVTKHMEKVD
ncbi:uncharacterized protein PAC_00667 [Phialocephala subalpina]|uniref:Uncharacterized protein n=1 Tax=Phialocephala subalpina TaxID=576137 RepID=A0A1L7WDC1_9HELO|nr:uncharacterized protein PAC_00667 [Phialocephala subalpina]